MREKTRRSWTKEEEDFLLANYVRMGPSAIARALGRSYSSVANRSQRFGLSMPLEARRAIIRAMTPQRAATLRRVYAVERFRMRSGLPQQTKLRINDYPKRVCDFVHRAVSVHGYFHCDGEPFDALYYDEDTRRMARETRHAEKYGVKFIDFNA